MKFIPFNKGTWIKGKDYSKKVLFTEKELSQQGAVAQIVRIKPGKTVKLHLHKKQTEVFLAVSGQATILISGKRLKIKAGDAILCQPGDQHGVENKSKQDFVLAVFKTNFRDKDFFEVK